MANDLDERLKYKDTFIFLKKPEHRTPALGNEYSFIVLADIHMEGGSLESIKELKNIIIPEQVKFVVVLGDITNNHSENDLLLFLETVSEFDVPFYPVIGNYDILFSNWDVWKEHIGSTRYRITGDTASLFILDSANSFFGKEQLDWLEREIRNTQGNTFVFTHSALFASGLADIHLLSDIKERARIVSILRNRCNIMFTGHLHKRVLNHTGGVQFISIEDFKRHNVYCLVNVKDYDVTFSFKSL
ncbi:MAG: metallophosphoesterase [Treponema sp.]|nr:metallophosphoesterase [Treponema sp.]